MSRLPRSRGFSLIEMLLVVAVIGILSGIAIPSFLGQRHRSRVIGDAMANAKALQMGMESRKADNGTYGVDGPYQWNATYNAGDNGYVLLPTFRPSGNSRMNFQITIANGGLSYTLNVNDSTMAGTPLLYSTNQTGQELFRSYK